MLKSIKREKVEDIVKRLQAINNILGTKYLVPIFKKKKKLLTIVCTSYIIKNVAARQHFV